MELPINYEDAHWSTRRAAREAYIEMQNGKCCHCNELLSGKPSKEIMSMSINPKLFPENFFKWPIHLHHCHKTGMTIGAVHNRCNAALWQYHGE